MLDSWWVTAIQKNYLKGNVCVSAASVIFHACQGCFVRTLTITLVHRAFQSVNPSQSTVEYRSMCCRCVTQTAKAAVMGCSVPCTVVMTALMLCVILNHTHRTCFVFVGSLEVRAAGVPGVTHGEASQRYTLMVRTSAGADLGGFNRSGWAHFTTIDSWDLWCRFQVEGVYCDPSVHRFSPLTDEEEN